MSILESDGDDQHPYGGGDDSDTDNSDGESFSFPGTSTNTSTWDTHPRDPTGSLSSGYYEYCYDDGRASSFNTRPYKRQPSSCEWDHHGSTALVALGGSRQVSASTRCSSGNVSGANTCTTDGGGSTSPCSSNGEHSGATSAAMSPLLLSESAPSGLVGEWGQFVDVISTDERCGGIGSNKKARPPQPLAFSPGLGGGSCIVGPAPSPSAADTSTNLPYFPKSRRRSSGGRAPPRRRASSVGSQHDNTIPTGTTGSPRRRFALTPRSASRVVGKVRSSSLFLENASVRSSKSAGGGPSPPPPSPSLGPLSLRQGAFPSGQDAVSEQPIMQRPSLDDVSFAMDKMQV